MTNHLDVKQLQLEAVKVREGIVTATHGAKSGHPGGSLSAADMFTYLYFNEMRIDPANPKGRIGIVLFSPRVTPPPDCMLRWQTGAFSRWKTWPPCATLTAICRDTPT